MADSTRTPYTNRIPTDKETRDRQAFQALHPEVGFTFRLRPEPPHWLAYWLDTACKPRHAQAATLGDLLEEVKPLFGAAGS